MHTLTIFDCQANRPAQLLKSRQGTQGWFIAFFCFFGEAQGGGGQGQDEHGHTSQKDERQSEQFINDGQCRSSSFRKKSAKLRLSCSFSRSAASASHSSSCKPERMKGCAR